MIKRTDAHCHVFNILMVSIKALLEQVHDTSCTVVAAKSCAATEATGVKAAHPLIERLKKIAELIAIFTSDSEKILARLNNHYKDKGDFQLFPLMFDGDFLLDSASIDDVQFIKEQIGNVRDHVKGQNTRLKAANVDTNATLTSNETELLLNFFDKLESDINDSHVKSSRLKSSKEDGFTRQYQQLVAIKNMPEYKDRIFPFLGVDPRRTNINTFLPQVGKDQIFSGIKVYPPNGFSPADPRLDEMYATCIEKRLPIISHCSFGGFATPARQIFVEGIIVPLNCEEPEDYKGMLTFENGISNGFNEMVQERAHILNNPKIWRKVLEKHPNLLLVLAHFGEGSDEWRSEILKMLYDFPNLYTDVSCMSNENSLKQVKAIYDSNPDIRHKIMYGSDYFLDMFFNDSFDDYYNRILNVFNNGSFDQLSVTNPQAFMDKWY
jgi:predicted TIM-barrel fold metal-dependent hydrolase